MSNDDPTLPHARALFGAISITLSAFGCAPAVPPPSNETVIVVPAPAPTPAPAPAAVAVSVVDAAAPTNEPPQPEDSATVAATPPPAPVPPKPKRNKKPLKQQPIIVEGRPFLVRGRARVAALDDGAGRGSGWSERLAVEAPTDPAARDALIAHYTDWALAEHASIASFARFTLQLLAVGAPSELVARAIDAMADETRHARFGFGLVRALSGRELHPGSLEMDHALEGHTDLESVLRLVVREGMIGETLAALEVRAAAELAEPPALRAALATIADEESRHAELAYAFAAWAIGREPELAAVIDEELRAWDAPALPAAAGLERWGILDETRRRAARASGWSNVVTPLASQLFASQKCNTPTSCAREV